MDTLGLRCYPSGVCGGSSKPLEINRVKNKSKDADHDSDFRILTFGVFFLLASEDVLEALKPLQAFSKWHLPGIMMQAGSRAMKVQVDQQGISKRTRISKEPGLKFLRFPSNSIGNKLEGVGPVDNRLSTD